MLYVVSTSKPGHTTSSTDVSNTFAATNSRCALWFQDRAEGDEKKQESWHNCKWCTNRTVRVRTVWRNRVRTKLNECLCSVASTLENVQLWKWQMQTILHSHAVASDWNFRDKIPKFPSPTSLIFSGAAFWTSWDETCQKKSNRSVTCESIWMNWFCTFVVTVVVSGNKFQLLEKKG